MMNNRTRTFWLPALAALTGAMAWRLILQRSFPPSEPLLNHAGLPLTYQLFWLAALPFVGAGSAYLSGRAGGGRFACLTAAAFPSIVLVPLWIVLATRMKYPSPSQWFGLFCGVMNWIVTPGMALLLGAWFQVKTQSPGSKNVRAFTVNVRTKTFWLPALVSLTAAMAGLAISTSAGIESRVVARGWANYVAYIPWLLTLPLCGAAAAYLSRRAGGQRWARLAAALFPVIAMMSLVGALVAMGKFVFAKPQWFYLSSALLLGVVVPGAALLLGAAPFAKASRVRSAN